MKYDPYNILIVEDEAAHADLTEYPVPSLILLDIKLPGISDRVLKLVKKTSELRKIPVIMLSTPHRR